MDLQVQSPLGMFEAIVQGESGIPLSIRTVHRLEEKELKIQLLEPLRLSSNLGEDQLQFISRPQD